MVVAEKIFACMKLKIQNEINCEILKCIIGIVITDLKIFETEDLFLFKYKFLLIEIRDR